MTVLGGGRSRRRRWLAAASANHTPNSHLARGRRRTGQIRTSENVFSPFAFFTLPELLPAKFLKLNPYIKHLPRDDDLFISCPILPTSAPHPPFSLSRCFLSQRQTILLGLIQTSSPSRCTKAEVKKIKNSPLTGWRFVFVL